MNAEYLKQYWPANKGIDIKVDLTQHIELFGNRTPFVWVGLSNMIKMPIEILLIARLITDYKEFLHP